MLLIVYRGLGPTLAVSHYDSRVPRHHIFLTNAVNGLDLSMDVHSACPGTPWHVTVTHWFASGSAGPLQPPARPWGGVGCHPLRGRGPHPPPGVQPWVSWYDPVCWLASANSMFNAHLTHLIQTLIKKVHMSFLLLLFFYIVRWEHFFTPLFLILEMVQNYFLSKGSSDEWLIMSWRQYKFEFINGK